MDRDIDIERPIVSREKSFQVPCKFQMEKEDMCSRERHGDGEEVVATHEYETPEMYRRL